MEDVRPVSSTGNGVEGEPRLTGGWPCRKPGITGQECTETPSPRARMRDMHEIQAESDANGWKNADAGARGTMV